MNTVVVHLWGMLPTCGIVSSMKQQIDSDTWVGKFSYTRSNLMNGLGPVARRAQRNHRGVGTPNSQHTGMVRVRIRVDQTATCILDLKVDSKVVYTVAVDTEKLVGITGRSLVSDTADAVRWLLGEVFGCPTLEMQDLDGLVAWTYHQIYGQPMRPTKHSVVPRLIHRMHRTDAVHRL